MAADWNGYPGDAHDAGFLAMNWRQRLPADAHDAGLLVVDWKQSFQVLLMMLGSWRGIGKGIAADAHDVGLFAVNLRKMVSSCC